jgi:hypothetical protein
MWIVVVAVLVWLAGCSGPAPATSFPVHRMPVHPSFLTRVQQDCLDGHQWACDMLQSLSQAARARETR